MIDRVHFENFKSLVDVTLDVGRFTVLVGANGCGKSSVLQGLQLMSQTGVQSPTDRDVSKPFGRFASIYDGPRAPERLIYGGHAGEMLLGMRHVDGDQLQVKIFVTHPAGTMPVPSGFEVSVVSSAPLRCQVPPADRSTSSWDQVYAVLDHDRVRKFAPAAYLRLDAIAMVRTTVQEDEVPRVDFDGGGLASVLAWMKGANEDELAQITAKLRQVVPGVKRIKTYRPRVTTRSLETVNIDGQPVWRPVEKTQTADRFAIEFDGGLEVPADLLSQGTVLTLGLLAKLHERPRPRLLLLDSLAQGLHLVAQAQLVHVVRELMSLDPELQIVCTTHSPYLLDLFEPAEVRVLALDAERRTHARPLTDHPEFGKWKFGTQTGELWAALGEEWVITGVTG